MFGNNSIKRLRRMLDAIRSRDFTLHYSLERLSGEERLLAEEINAVISEFRETQARQEAMYGQYETLLNQVNAMLFVDDCHGNVVWMNQRAVHNLCGFRISHISMLEAVHPDLPAALDSLQPGQQRLLRLRIADHDVDWNISMTKYFRQGDEARLFSIENIQTALQQSEAESQKKLVSVLTHEIMNSLSPIISLSDTLASSWSEINGDEVGQALNAIHRRSAGLLQFVDNYRQLSRLSQPKKEIVKVGDLIGDLQSLFTSSHIIYNIEDPTDELLIDRSQMEQVLINLLKNAEEAMRSLSDVEAVASLQGDSQPRVNSDESGVRVITHADRPNRHFLITVEDTGEGILPEVLDRIFVPFFTTKPKGSGIGLAICKQIVAMHNGIIKVKSEPGHTEFTIQLPL